MAKTIMGEAHRQSSSNIPATEVKSGPQGLNQQDFEKWLRARDARNRAAARREAAESMRDRAAQVVAATIAPGGEYEKASQEGDPKYDYVYGAIRNAQSAILELNLPEE